MITYKDSGVDIDAANNFIEEVSDTIKATHNSSCLGTFGGFGGLFELPTGYKHPVLVSGTDGVGTKLRFAQKYPEFEYEKKIGYDLVAMCYNDVICSGAKPLYFMDYYGTSNLDIEKAKKCITSISEACSYSGIPLLGGETAELPKVFQEGEYDIVGFCTGIIEKENIIDGYNCIEGDILLALPSSGIHSNGFSLINRLDEEGLLTKDLVERILKPTEIYTQLPEIIKHNNYKIFSMSHITGGGLIDNPPRMIPKEYDLEPIIDMSTLDIPDIFLELQELAGLSDRDLMQTFNCGVGMILVVGRKHIVSIMNLLPESWIIGNIKKKIKHNI